MLRVRDGGRKKEDGGGNIALSLKRVDTDKHGYLKNTDSALTVVTGYELLFLTECNKYNNIRETYFSRIKGICSGFTKIKREEK